MEVASPSLLVAGTRVGRYVIVRELGAGAMGTVYEARDPELERSVALKILHAKSLVAAMRLMREAQVLAQLQHPNVVAIHALDLHEDQVFIAMELVDGERLDRYLARARPDRRHIIALFVQAGRGLVAAHAKAIVHRDVKPSNILVDAAGRVRVGDFGLARQLAGDEPDSAEAAAAATAAAGLDTADAAAADAGPARPVTPGDSPLTHAGAILGTPYFMSPEQHRGKRATPASDQFSFCVALWLALFGEHPFAIDDHVGLAVTEGRRRPRAGRAKLPRRLQRALDRGLAVEPERRHASMAALLAILERAPVRGRQLALGAAAALAVAGAIAWGLAQRPAAAETCPVPEAQLADVWGAPRQATIRAQLTGADPAGGARFEAAARMVEPYVEAWRAAHLEAGRATRVRGGQSDSLLDARMRCLERRRAELAASLGLFAAARNPATIDGALRGLTALTPVAACSDDDAMQRDANSPLDPITRARAGVVLQRIVEIDASERARAPIELRAPAAAAVAEARALGHPPLLAGALALLARVEILARHTAEAEVVLHELAQVAAHAHDDRAEAYAWTRLVTILGARGKGSEGLAHVGAASAAIVRAHEPPELRADLLHAQAEVLGATGKPREAVAKLAEARALAEAAPPGSPLAAMAMDLWQETGTALAMAGDFPAAEAAYRRAIELARASSGPDSLDEGIATTNLAVALTDAGDLARALPLALEGARIHERRAGQTAAFARSLGAIGTIEMAQRRFTDAHATFARALRIMRAELPPGDLTIFDTQHSYAWSLGELGRNAEAVAAYDEIIAAFDRAGATSFTLAAALLNRGDTTAQAGRDADALPDLARALALYESLLGRDAQALAPHLVTYARSLVLAGRAAEALGWLERGLALHHPDFDAEIRGWLGCALVTTGRDRVRGLALARSVAPQFPEVAACLARPRR